VIFLRVIDPRRAVVEVSDYIHQTSQFAQTTLRLVLGEVKLDELLARREKINCVCRAFSISTPPRSVKVANAEVQAGGLP
jgi:regulator of protease activity HflC (stomatin/prohibitin superfamily)